MSHEQYNRIIDDTNLSIRHFLVDMKEGNGKDDMVCCYVVSIHP